MIEFVYKKTDLRYVFLRGDRSDCRKLEDYLNKIPQYMFLPSFAGIPRPEVFLNKFKTKAGEVVYWIHAGLKTCVVNWAQKEHIEIKDIAPNFDLSKSRMDMTLEEFENEVNSWNMSITPRPYQIEAAWTILRHRHSLSELATRAGKTLIAYMVFRYMLSHGAKKILMIVPSIHLVKQGVADFQEYAEFFKAETVWAKGEMCESPNLTIGTFQSLVQRADRRSKKYNPKFFKDYDVVCVDEAHHLVCKSINTILGLDFMQEVKLKFGFTGTLPKEETIENFACQSLMGPKIQEISAMELVDAGFLARPNIIQMRIHYQQNLTPLYIKCGEYLCSNYVVENGKKVLLPEEERDLTMKHAKSLPYAIERMKALYEDDEYAQYLIDICKSKGSNLLMLEQMIIHRLDYRLNVMGNLIESMDKNVIVFAHNDTYLSKLRDYFASRFPLRKIYMIKGNTPIKSREKIVDAMNKEDGAILCASYGCCGTGLTFKNVDYGIFAQSFKSDIIVNQSVGRLMMKTSEKDQFYLYDIIDCLPTKKLYMQGLVKVKTYKENGFDCIVKDI